MKRAQLLALSALTSLILFSCKKDHPVNPIVDPPLVKPGDSTLTLTVVTQLNPSLILTDSSKRFELIARENTGKIVMDTILPVNQTIALVVHTGQSRLDITTVSYSDQTKQYQVRTDEYITPSAWTSRYKPADTTSAPPLPVSAATGSIHYTNYPNMPQVSGALCNFRVLNVNPFLTNIEDHAPTSNDLDMTYTYLPNDYAYLLFPAAALYNFHKIGSTKDTVDLSHMDPAIKLRFIRPAVYTLMSPVQAVGYIDTLSGVTLSLNYANFFPIAGVDFVYPGKYFQAYDFIISGNNSDQTVFANYHCTHCAAIPDTIPFPDESTYTISSTQNNNFSVKFSSHVPDTYQFSYTSTGLVYYLSVPSDSTTFHPLDYLASLKSQLLKGKDVSQLKISAFGFKYVSGPSSGGSFNKTLN